MNKSPIKIFFSRIGLTVLLLAIGQCRPVEWFGSKGDLSHFAGIIANTDIPCASRLVGKGTSLPAQVYFTTQLKITAYSAEATQYHKDGFSVAIRDGGLNTNTINLVVHGAKLLPYPVIVNFYCAAPMAPAVNAKIVP